jgi:hypothetical protein
LRLQSYIKLGRRSSGINVMNVSVDFVLKTFENKLSLLVLVLTDPVFCVDWVFLVVEHVAAQVQNGSPVHLGRLPL